MILCNRPPVYLQSYRHEATSGHDWLLKQKSKILVTNLLLHQLKCLGEDKTSERKEGSSCDRCRRNGIQCVFPQPSPTKGSKRRRSVHATSRTSKTDASTPSPATMASTAPAPQPRTAMTGEARRDNMAYSTTGDNKALSDKPSGPFIGLGPGKRVKQLNMTETQSIGGQDRYSYPMNNGSDPAHQFDFNLSMLSTADDSHDLGFLPDRTDGWPAPAYGMDDGNVYGKLQAMPHVDHQRMYMLISSHRELQYRRLSSRPFFNDISWRVPQLDLSGILGYGFTTTWAALPMSTRRKTTTSISRNLSKVAPDLN